MSDINLDFTVSNNSINFTVEPNDITITPTDIQLSIYAAGAALAAGANGTVQFNSGGILGGSGDFTYDGPNATVNMATANVGNINGANINISTYANLGNAGNVHIFGGNNGYFLQTNGNGNLSWGTGTLGPGGTNASIQFNNGGNFDGTSNLTFNTATNTLNSAGNITGSYIIGNGSSLTSITGANVTGSVANATYANASGNINAATFAIENVALIGAQTGTYNFDFLTNVIKYSTANAAANLVLNFRGNSTTSTNTLLANGQSITATYVMTTGANIYYVTGIQIDGSSANIKYAVGGSPLPSTSSKNSYTFTIIKTSTTPTYDVLGSFTRYQ